MNVPPITGKEKEILAFMKETGYPVFHRSNMFYRDFQYAVRDYYRDKHKVDIGSRESDARGEAVIRALEAAGILVPATPNVWILHMEEYLNPPKAEEKKAETPAA